MEDYWDKTVRYLSYWLYALWNEGMVDEQELCLEKLK